MSSVMIWLSRLESTANKHRLAAGKAARTVKANAVLDEVLRAHNQEALSQEVVTNGAIVIHTQRLKSDPGGNLLS